LGLKYLRKKQGTLSVNGWQKSRILLEQEKAREPRINP
jgi:hypothetical protein